MEASGARTHEVATPQRTPAEAEALVLATIHRHAESILRLARRHSLCADDAHDAYQRGVEIFIRRAASLDADGAGAWLHTVVKHEAIAVRAARLRVLGHNEFDVDAQEARTEPSPDERALSFERLARSAEALQRLKPQEVRALWLKAQGHSYQDIAEICDWTYTKVNRCITEGRRSFLERYAGIEAGAECERWAPVLSAIVDGEATPEQVADARPHLRNCAGCRATLAAMRGSAAPLAALLPVATVALAGAEPASHRGGGLLLRVYEALAGGVHERAVLSAARFQAAFDAAPAGKLAAVAASAAAVAGGGVAVDHAVTTPARHHRPVAAQPARVAGAPGVAGAVTGSASVVARSAPAHASHDARRSRRRRDPSTEFGFDGSPAPPTTPPRAVVAATPAASAAPSSGSPPRPGAAVQPRSGVPPGDVSDEFGP